VTRESLALCVWPKSNAINQAAERDKTPIYTHSSMKLASETQHCKSDKMSLRKIEADMRVFWAWEYKVEFLQEDD
jgi:hypothetical protein